MTKTDAPLYFHFLDRELGASVDFELPAAQAEHLAKCALLATTSPLYCGLSLLWESSGIHGETLRLFSRMLEAGVLQAISHHATLPEFLSSRQSIYSHDATRYPMYFKSQAAERSSFRPTIYKDTGTTDTLAQGMFLWASGDARAPIANLEIEALVRPKIKLTLANREEQAITFPLFAPHLSGVRKPAEVFGFVRRRISELYTEHYLRFGGGDILTGISGLEYFDHLARSFPIHDVILLGKLVEIAGLGYLLQDPWIQHEWFWLDLLSSRGSDPAHQDFRRLIRGILIGLDSILDKYILSSHFARRVALLERIKYCTSRAPCVSSVKNYNLLIIEAGANLRGFYHSLSKVMGIDLGVFEAAEGERMQADILIVTATEIETQTVIRLISEQFGRGIDRKFLGDRTYYDLGIIGGARTFMVQSEMGSGGPAGSILTVKNGIDTLSPTAVIMVGIAFGIDNSSQKIGTITVSRQLRPYELQRVGTDSTGGMKVISRGDKPLASVKLLDRLRSGTLDWVGSRVEFGVVLSGDKLVDNVDFRDQLLNIEPEAIGGEMEGAGLYAAAQSAKVDWILVKGISDWADGKKRLRKAERQRIAAENAVSFVLHVLKQGGFAGK